MKVCNKCGGEKEDKDFYPDSWQSDGRKTFCIACDNEQSRLYWKKVKDFLTEEQKNKKREAWRRWKAKQKGA